MDVNGARELARVLRERHGDPPLPVRPRHLLSSEAAPIFHWFGVEPPEPSSSERPAEDFGEPRLADI
jgi:hypothetical protein